MHSILVASSQPWCPHRLGPVRRRSGRPRRQWHLPPALKVCVCVSLCVCEHASLRAGWRSSPLCRPIGGSKAMRLRCVRRASDGRVPAHRQMHSCFFGGGIVCGLSHCARRLCFYFLGECQLLVQDRASRRLMSSAHVRERDALQGRHAFSLPLWTCQGGVAPPVRPPIASPPQRRRQPRPGPVRRLSYRPRHRSRPRPVPQVCRSAECSWVCASVRRWVPAGCGAGAGGGARSGGRTYPL